MKDCALVVLVVRLSTYVSFLHKIDERWIVGKAQFVLHLESTSNSIVGIVLSETTPMIEKLVVGSVYTDYGTNTKYCNRRMRQQS